MAKPLVSDELWAVVEPLLPPRATHPKGGHPFTVPDRAALTGIIFVLKTGIPWEYLPQEMGCGSGMTCWRRLRDWQAAGVWQRLHEVLLDRLGQAAKIDWTRASADSATVPAKGVKRGRPRRCTSAPTPPIGRNQGRNTIWSVTDKAFRSRACRPRPM
jgi:transposase